jgi:hypothetical protein
MDTDAEYLAFLEQLSKPASSAPSAEEQLDQRLKENQPANVAPLVQFLIQSRALKMANPRGLVRCHSPHYRQLTPIRKENPVQERRMKRQRGREAKEEENKKGKHAKRKPSKMCQEKSKSYRGSIYPHYH